jgi:hypothetical protein
VRQSSVLVFCTTAVRHEYCETPEDFVARRTRLAFLDKLACQQALPKVSHVLLSPHLHKACLAFLDKLACQQALPKVSHVLCKLHKQVAVQCSSCAGMPGLLAQAGAPAGAALYADAVY